MLEKTASHRLDKDKYARLREIYAGKKIDKSWIDLECDESFCVYKGLKLDKENPGEARSIWIKNGKVVKETTVREYIGKRPWLFE